MDSILFSLSFYCLHISGVLGIILLILNRHTFNLIHYLAYGLLTFSILGYILQTIHYLYDRQFFQFYLLIFILGVISFLFILNLYFKIRYLNIQLQPEPTQFLGYFATIYQGKAKTDQIAIAYLKDENGQEHYIQVFSEFGEIDECTPVLIIRPKNQYYIVRNIQALVQSY